jgi:hypothetical protein
MSCYYGLVPYVISFYDIMKDLDHKDRSPSVKQANLIRIATNADGVFETNQIAKTKTFW